MILDVYDRRIVAHVVRKTCKAEGLSLIHDRGSQFTAWRFRGMVSDVGATDVAVAIREPLRQGVLPGMEQTESQLELPFATVVCTGKVYRVKGIVTNREGEGSDLIRWHYERCGKSEEAHAVMKSDLAGGTLPSGKFGANAAWWGIMVLAHNLHAAMRCLALPDPLKKKRLKGLRFALIDVPGRIVQHSRQMFVRLKKGHPAIVWLYEMRRAIGGLSEAPA